MKKKTQAKLVEKKEDVFSQGDNFMSIIPTLDIEEYELPVDQEEEVRDESGGALSIGLVGAGQCGGRLAEAFYQLGYKKTIYLNTTEQDKNNIPTKLIINLGGSIGGAGKNMDLAAEALESDKESLYNLMSKVFGKVDHILVCAGMGGGTGGGTVVSILELARKYMRYIGFDDTEKRVGAIITLPSIGESSSPIVASNTLSKSKELSVLADTGVVSPLIVIDNDKIKNLYRNLTVAKFYPTVNNTVAQLLNVFNSIANQSSEFVTFDATDFVSVLQCGGHLIMGMTVVTDYQNKTGISAALKANLTKTLLASDFDLTTAKTAAVIVVAGRSVVETVPGLMESIEYGFDTIAALTGNAMVHRGVYADDGNDKVRVFTMISGLKEPTKRYERIK